MRTVFAYAVGLASYAVIALIVWWMEPLESVGEILTAFGVGLVVFFASIPLVGYAMFGTLRPKRQVVDQEVVRQP